MRHGQEVDPLNVGRCSDRDGEQIDGMTGSDQSFEGVAYPVAGAFPRIIGFGSDKEDAGHGKRKRRRNYGRDVTVLGQSYQLSGSSIRMVRLFMASVCSGEGPWVLASGTPHRVPGAEM